MILLMILKNQMLPQFKGKSQEKRRKNGCCSLFSRNKMINNNDSKAELREKIKSTCSKHTVYKDVTKSG